MNLLFSVSIIPLSYLITICEHYEKRNKSIFYLPVCILCGFVYIICRD
jgi:hypothetical protein